MLTTLMSPLWLLAGVIVLAAAGLPLGVEAQLALALTCLAIMAVVKLARLGGAFRSIYLGLGTFIILRYVFWRVFNTIPSISSPTDFIPGVILVIAEGYCVIMLFLSLFTILRPLNRAPAPRLPDNELPSVDVFVPSYNEGTEILATTLVAAKNLTYPQHLLKVFLLDDGGTDEKLAADDPEQAMRAANRRRSLQALCAELGTTYLARSDNQHAKAGNLNNGLANSSADLIVVFDADHAPARMFLTETVGYFKDPKLFLVQTPHFFLNTDPIEKNLSAPHSPSENEMFYGLVQKGLDHWNSAFFCGSAAVLRREALEQVGGFHGSSITEDAETALELHSRGWKSAYVDKPMIAGLQPETFESFIGQRSRWCRGMVQILLLKTPLFKKGLTVAQRLCYLSSSMFWLFPLSRIAFIFAPMFYIFFDLKVYVATKQEFFAYTVTYMLSALMIQSYIFGKFRWPWVSDVYEYIQSVHLFRAVLSVFIDPRRPKFNVTAKGLSTNEDRLSSLAWPYFAIFGLVAASLATVVYRYTQEPNSRDMLTVVGIWTGLNLLLSGMALGAVSELRERRAMPRVDTSRKAALLIGEETFPLVIEDMSFGGCKVRPTGAGVIPPKSTGVLRLQGVGPSDEVFEVPVVSAGRRIQDNSRGVGLKFYNLNTDRFRMIADVVFADVGRFHQARSARYRTFGVCVASVLFIYWWAMQTGRGLYYAVFRRGHAVVAATSTAPTEHSAA